MQDKESAYKKIAELVERFQEQIVSYKKADYNETLTRRDFIDPFFKALGWDIDNESGYAEAYREVIHEDKVKIGGATKAPDYSFRLSGGKRLFFVEAKKPSVVIKEEIPPAYQVRRYGWSAKLPISIITDFEEFSIYDCSKKPLPNDKASVARIKYLTFNEYLAEFDFLWDTFSKEKVLKGSFDKFVEGTSNKKGTATVDKDFLQSLDGWRTLLANSISKLNKELDEDELNFAVQQTIDRIIFLRIAEDRNIEPYGNLAFAVKQGDFYSNLYSIFKDADDKYNSGLFSLKKDTISENLKIENKVLKSIINQLYYPESPYEFSVLSVEILGSAYEQFLGKQIKINKYHKAVIEEKPEVRKAGGVYYTPQYIVNYIVENTVGKLLENKTPIEVSKIKIVDPACGSGSFLLGAFQYLLDWHKDYYSKTMKPSRGGKDNPLTPEGSLTTSEKKRILLNNIFGVDIDINAVEVTKLSLLLKCLEGETHASISNQLSLFNERVLPTLDDNIKSGNSLIDLDFYDGELDFGLEKKVKPFSWQKAFPVVFKQGGFDAVIGNPPYFSLSTLDSTQIQYYKTNFKVFETITDIYCLFIEKALKITTKHGLISFITSNQWLQTNYGRTLRKFLALNSNPLLLINFGGVKIFQDATVDTSILVLENYSYQNRLLACHFRNDFRPNDSISEYLAENKIILDNIVDGRWKIITDNSLQLKNKIKNAGRTLTEWDIKINRGILTGLNEAFIIDTPTKNKLISQCPEAQEIIRPILRGRDIHKYHNIFADLWLIVAKNGTNMKLYPPIYERLKTFGARIKNRTDQGEFWYNLRACSYYELFENDKLIYPETTVRRSEFYFDDESFFIDKTCFMITGQNLKYLNGVLSSKLLEWYLESELRLLGKRSIQYSKQYMEQIPIPTIEMVETELVNLIISLVDQLLQLNKEKQVTSLHSKVDQIQGKIDYCEDKINKIVYELYGLTEEEIKIVEGE